MQYLLQALTLITLVFLIVNYVKSKSLELVALLVCGIVLVSLGIKSLFHEEASKGVSELALGLAMLGIGLEVSPGALVKSGKMALILAAFQLTVGGLIFFYGGAFKPLGIAVLFQSTPLVAQITHATKKEVRGALLGLVAIQDVISGGLTAVAGSGSIANVVLILVGYLVVGAAIYLLAGRSWSKLNNESTLEYYFEHGIDPTEHAMRFVLVLIVILAVGALGSVFGLGLPSSLFLLGFLLPTDSKSSQSRHVFESEVGKLAELGKGIFFLLLGMELNITFSVETLLMAGATLAAIVIMGLITSLVIIKEDRATVFRAMLASGEFGAILLVALKIVNPGVVLGIVAAMLLSSVNFPTNHNGDT